MTAREAERLLGGWAAGTLTETERSALMTCAMEDQALFDALADEEALRELMADAASRAELLRAVSSRRTLWWRQAWVWATATSLSAVVAGFVWWTVGRQQAPLTVNEAEVRMPAPEPASPAQALREAPKPTATPAAPAPSRARASERDAGAPEGSAGAATRADANELADREQRQEPPKDVAKEEKVALPKGRAAGPPVEPVEAAAQQAPVQTAAAPPAASAPVLIAPATEPEPSAKKAVPRAAAESADERKQLFRAPGTLASRVVGGAFAWERRTASGAFAVISSGASVRVGDTVRLRIAPPGGGAVTVHDAASGELLYSGDVVAGASAYVSIPTTVAGTRRLRVNAAGSTSAATLEIRP